MTSSQESTLLAAARRLLGAEVDLLPGGFSGETFSIQAAGERLVLRLYVRRPERAGVDAALLARLARVLPVPEILEARTTAGDVQRPPFLLTRQLPGERLDLVLPAADGRKAATLGRCVGSTLALIGAQAFPRPGGFADETLDPDPLLNPGDLGSWARYRLRDRWPLAEIAALAEVIDEVAPLLAEVQDEARLVHSDFNPKNLLVEPESGAVTGVLDWEFAYSGSPLADVGNMLRFPPQQEFVRSFVATYADRAAGLSQHWLDSARAIDLFALVELAGREGQNPVADASAMLLRRIAATRDLSGGRPDPRD